jgi:hypothetical protein
LLDKLCFLHVSEKIEKILDCLFWKLTVLFKHPSTAASIHSDASELIVWSLSKKNCGGSGRSSPQFCLILSIKIFLLGSFL